MRRSPASQHDRFPTREKSIKGSDTPVAGLRISISGGGCSGFQYGMRLEEARADDDPCHALLPIVRSVSWLQNA